MSIHYRCQSKSVSPLSWLCLSARYLSLITYLLNPIERSTDSWLVVQCLVHVLQPTFFPLLVLSLFQLFLCPFLMPCTHMHSRCLLLIQIQPISLLVAIETVMLNGSPMNFHHDIFKVAMGTMKTAPLKTGFENRIVPVTKTLCSTSLMPECKCSHTSSENE